MSGETQPTMQYTTLGRTGLTVSVAGLVVIVPQLFAIVHT